MAGRVLTGGEVRRRPVLLARLAAGFATLVDSSLLGIVTPSLRASLGASTPALWSLAIIEFAMGSAHGASEAPNRALTLAPVPSAAGGLAAGFLQLSQRLTATITIAAATGIFLAADSTAKAQAVSQGLIVTVALLTLSLAVSLTGPRRVTGE